MASRSGRLGERIDFGDAATGLVLVLVAGWFAVTALRRLPIGTPASMGPGFFPLMVAAGLGALGLVIVIGSLRRATRPTGFTGARGTACVLAAPLLFAFGVGPFGFVPSIAAATFLAAFGSRLMTVRLALVLAVALTVLSTVLFVQLLNMPVALFGPRLGF